MYYYWPVLYILSMAESKNIFEQIGITPIQALIVIGGGALLYKGGQKLGLIDSAQKQNETKLLAASYLSPSYIDTLKRGSKKYMTWTNDNTPKDICRKIRDSKGTFKDNDAQLWGALRRIQYKTQAGVVAMWFNRMYSVDLTQYLSTFQNVTEMDNIYKYFESLPEGLI